MEAVKERGVQLLSLILLVLAWAAASLIVGERILPLPTAVFPVAWDMVASGTFAEPLFTSLYRLLLVTPGVLLPSPIGCEAKGEVNHCGLHQA